MHANRRTKEGFYAAGARNMTTSVEMVSYNANTADAARKVKDLDIGAIPVCDAEKY